MTINEIFGLRNQGRVEEAYEAARIIYANDKSPHASSVMFWTAVDMLKKRVGEGRIEEARKICMALDRLIGTVNDEKGWMHDTMRKCHEMLSRGETRGNLLENADEHIKMGIWGEDLATSYLCENGYVILERDWHSGHRDIDIIARKNDCIVFVEVKTRRNRDFMEPEMAVGYRKQRNLLLAINHYIHYRKIDTPWRFDVITVVGELDSKKPEINHIEDFNISNSPRHR